MKIGNCGSPIETEAGWLVITHGVGPMRKYCIGADAPLQGGVYGNGVTKAKGGVEATYSVLPWLAFSARFDQVSPNVDDARYSFAVLSPRIILRTGWSATDQVVLQYSHWVDGSLATVRTGAPPVDNVRVIPDSDMVSLAASMWW